MRIMVIALCLFFGAGIVYDVTVVKPKHYLSLISLTNSRPHSLQTAPKTPMNTHAMIQSAARKYNVPTAFVHSIVAAESNFDPGAVSSKGAVGLMQVMPATAQGYGLNASIPEQNVDAGTRYLGWLLKRYCKYRNGLKRAIAAYNAGPAVVDKYHGVPPYRETRCYVTRVLGYLRQFQTKPFLMETAEARDSGSAQNAD